MEITPTLWQRLEPLLDRALELEAAPRDEWLSALDATQPELAPMIRRMLETHDRAERARELETVPKLAAAPPPASHHHEGERVGPFRLVRALGRGGMGEVWLAEQADGRVTREVALKLPALYLHRGAWEYRFQRERDILARLTHPNIAHLYDAGVTEAGQPWLAMELVEGTTLLEAARSRGLSIPGRLALFRQVLAAVSHAHRHLVVHRDLKPANILIDAAGQAKLLDFGIAKLVDAEPATAEARDVTREGARVMTLRYAAPEQAAGGSITTATDIYALGVVLHELVTGASPHRAVRDGKPLTEAMLLGEDPSLPSGLAPREDARQVAGDLDAILLKAMRRDPAARYASADQFDEDIARHLGGRPVAARAGTWRYLAERFIARNKLPLAAATAFVALLGAGVFLVDQQRRAAVSERERAERHFASVRKLANSFMFDVHGEIENLAGSLKARQLLVGTSLQYLDSLANEGGGDPDLAVEVAAAYRKLAELKGVNPMGANVGDPEAALANLRKARALLGALDEKLPDHLALQRERREISLALASLLKANKATDEGVDESMVAVRIAERVVALPGADIGDRKRLAAAYGDLGHSRGVHKAERGAGLESMGKALAILEPLAREAPQDPVARELLAISYERSSVITEGTNAPEDVAKGADLQARANAIYETLVRDHPEHVTYKRNLARGYANLAASENAIDRRAEARDHAARAVQRARELAAAAPQDAGMKILLMRSIVVSCEVESDAGSHERAIAFAHEATAVHASIPPAAREALVVRANLSRAEAYLGISQAGIGMDAQSNQPRARRLALLKEGRANLLRARAFRQELVDRGIGSDASGLIVRQIDEMVAKIDRAAAQLSRS